MPNMIRARASISIAISEFPPRAKKSSSGPTSSSPSSSHQRWARPASTAVPLPCGVGSATGCRTSPARPSVSAGSRPTCTNAAGTMCSGSRAVRYARTPRRKSSARAGLCSVKYAVSTWPPPGPTTGITHARPTAGCVASADSTSPGSTRNPSTFTCWSIRPKSSSLPSGRSRPVSPVRYIRPPGVSVNGSGRNSSAVRSGRRQ